MAPTGTTEWSVEAGWISILGGLSDLSAFDVRRWGDESAKTTDSDCFPAVLVKAEAGEIDDWGIAGYSDCTVDISVVTYAANDRTGPVCANAVAAIRDKLRASTLKVDLEQGAGNLHCYGIIQEGRVYKPAPDRYRSTVLTLTCYVSLANDVTTTSTTSTSTTTTTTSTTTSTTTT